MKKWMKTGLIWGGIMFIMMNFIFPFFTKEPITTKKVLISLPIWILAGILFGLSQKKRIEKEA
ncbi:hypothetical protein [Tenacibaculum aiptasiae]|uniref:hypothetical protein n=1 Tax=Tenacibaculum aiptasiae TaxID=426481 RepID=UPI00232E9193|nr:hypothetical protein [Tenacibaculum aiptasiae]